MPGAADALDPAAAVPVARCIASDEVAERDPRQSDDPAGSGSRDSGALDQERSGSARVNAEALAERRAAAEADQRAEPDADPAPEADRDLVPDADADRNTEADAGLDNGLGADLDAGLDAEGDAGLDNGLGAELDAGLDAEGGAGLDNGLGADVDGGLDADLNADRSTRGGGGVDGAERSALVEEMAQELAAVVAGSSDPTARRLAAALAAAGFEGEQVVDEATASEEQRGTTSRSRSGTADLADDLEARSDRVGADRAATPVCDERESEQDLAGGNREDGAADRGAALADVLEPASSRDEPRTSAGAAGAAGERGGTDIAAALERSSAAGGRTAG